MIMKTLRNLTVVGITTLMVCALSACGGSGNDSNASNNVPTEGILGELPALNVKYLAEQEQMRFDIENEANADKLTKLNKEFSEWEENRKVKLNEVLDALNGKEVPTEVAEGVPFSLDSNLKLYKIPSIVGYRKAQGILAKTTGKTTEKLSDMGELPNFTYVPYDSDGNVIELVSSTSPQLKTHGNIMAALPVGTECEFSATIHGDEAWAKFAKIVIMDKRSDAYKQIEAQFKNQ